MNRKKGPKALRSRSRARNIRLLLVDDHPIHLAALKHYLARRSRFRVATLFMDGIDSVGKAKLASPDVVLVNMRMPRFDGASVTKLLLETAPAFKIIGFSGPDERRGVLAMLRAGARGYVVSTCSSAEMLRAVETVYRGDLFFSAPVLKMIADDYASDQAQNNPGTAGELKDQERQIIARVADGRCNKEIADDLDLSVRTVEKYRERLMAKLKIKTASGLIKFAIRNGIASLD